VVLNWENSFNCHILYFWSNFLIVDSHLNEFLLKLSKVPFWCILLTWHFFVFWIITLKFTFPWLLSLSFIDHILLHVLLIYWVICKMNKSFLQRRRASCVFLSCKSNKSVLVKINFKGIIRSHQYVKPDIKFKTINEQRFMHVFWDNTALFLPNMSVLWDHFYSPTTWRSWWFDNV